MTHFISPLHTSHVFKTDIFLCNQNVNILNKTEKKNPWDNGLSLIK